jgi:hypothetical protein
MFDIVFLVATVAFFALMLGYVSLCERLGRSADATETSSSTTP